MVTAELAVDETWVIRTEIIFVKSKHLTSEHVPTLVESENRLLEVVDLLGSAMQNPNRGADNVIVSQSIRT